MKNNSGRKRKRIERTSHKEIFYYSVCILVFFSLCLLSASIWSIVKCDWLVVLNTLMGMIAFSCMFYGNWWYIFLRFQMKKNKRIAFLILFKIFQCIFTIFFLACLYFINRQRFEIQNMIMTFVTLLSYPIVIICGSQWQKHCNRKEPTTHYQTIKF